jgi:hypothetical protein
MGVEKNRWRTVDGVVEKRCPRCGEWLAFEGNFYRNKSAYEGFDCYCKECRKLISPWKKRAAL